MKDENSHGPSLYALHSDYDFAIRACESMHQNFQKLLKNVDEERAPELYQIRETFKQLLSSEDGCAPWYGVDSKACLSLAADLIAQELPGVMEAKIRARYDSWEVFEEEIEAVEKRMLLAIHSLSDRRFNLNLQGRLEERTSPFDDVIPLEEGRHEESIWLH